MDLIRGFDEQDAQRSDSHFIHAFAFLNTSQSIEKIAEYNQATVWEPPSRYECWEVDPDELECELLRIGPGSKTKPAL